MKSSKPKAEESKEELVKKLRHRKKQKYNEIRKQMEFYFTDSNLSKDRFLKKLVNEDEFVPLSIFLTFNRIISLTSSVDDLIKALSNSEILELSEDKTKIRRTSVLKIKENVDDLTIYVESLPPTADHDWVRNIFSTYGAVAYVSLPRYKKSNKIKEFAFVEFEQKSGVQKAINAFKDFGGVFTLGKEPEELASITTFLKEQEELKNDDIVKKEDDIVQKEEDICEKKEQIVEKNESDQEQPPKKRKKLEEFSENKLKIIEVSQKVIEEKVNVSVTETIQDETTKNEFSEEQIVDLKLKESEIISDKPQEPEIKLNIEEDTDMKTQISDEDEPNDVTDSEQATDIALDNSETTQTEKSKKTRIRRKKLPTKKVSIMNNTISDLRIMTKLDWKRLRNKYLNLQREKLKQVKQQLRHHHYNARTNKKNSFNKNVTPNKNINFYGAAKFDDKQLIENGDDKNITKNEKNTMNLEEKQREENALNKTPLFTYESGLIVNIKFQEPCLNVKDFKGEMRQYSQVKYVDVNEGNDYAYIRVENPASSATFIKQIASQEYTCSILNGQNEADYWNKIKQDREEKIKKNVRVKPERAKIKILKKVSHLRFDNDD